MRSDKATIKDAEGDDANSGGSFSGDVATWEDKSGENNHVDIYQASGLCTAAPEFIDGTPKAVSFISNECLSGGDILDPGDG